MAKKVKLLGYRCERCGHEWLPRDKDHTPRVCPKCKSPYWDRPRKDAAK
jgi:predicted Zn-ribbon and HTH transcriptional regulator